MKNHKGKIICVAYIPLDEARRLKPTLDSFYKNNDYLVFLNGSKGYNSEWCRAGLRANKDGIWNFCFCCDDTGYVADFAAALIDADSNVNVSLFDLDRSR